MTIDIVVPQIGEAVAELTLVSWLKAEGDPVYKGEVLFEIDSDKAIVEVEAFVDGTLSEILAPAGSAVLPQDVVARLQPAAEAVETVPETVSPVSAVVDSHKNGPKISPVAQRLADDLGVNLATVSGSGPAGRIVAEDVRRQAKHDSPPVDGALRIVASPKAKILARELQLDLRGLTGTGVDGMLRVKDVEAAARQTPAVASALPTTAQGLSKARQTIAQRTAQSKQTVPHFYLMADVNMTQVNALRHYCVATLGWERPPTYTDVLLRVAALALADMPEANLHFTEQGLQLHESVGVGVAIHTDAGLVAPVITGADQLDLKTTSQALRDLAARARARRMRPGDTGTKALVISNLGMYSVDAFIAIIDMPDPMILAVGQVADRVVPIDGQVAVQPMCTLTLSVDHRALDGVPAARFLERIKARLENPFDIVNANAVR